MNRRIIISEEERSKILGLHETRKQKEWNLINEAGPYVDPNTIPGVTDTTAPTATAPKTGALNRQVVQGAAGDPYQYKGEGGKYYYAFKKEGTNPKWIEQTKPEGIKAIQSKILDKATPQVATSTEPKMETLKATEVSKTITPTTGGTQGTTGILPTTLPKSSGNLEIDTWLTTDMGKAFSKITDPNQKEAMMDFLEKNDPTISKVGKDVARPILMGTISADTKLGRFGQKVGQGLKGFAKGFTGK